MTRRMVARSAVPKELRPFYDAAMRAHWTVDLGGGGHLRWRAPNGRMVFTSASPRHAGTHKVRADLRRAGLGV